MKTQITRISDTEYTIDGLTAYQDSSGQWHGHPDMNPAQIAAFQKHLKKTNL